MLGKKIVDLTSSFDRANWKAFQNWLLSPVHNTDQSLITLGGYFQKTTPVKDVTKLEAQVLWQQAYPNKKLNEGMLRVKLRQLTQQIESFLIWQKLEEDKTLRQRLLLKAQINTLSYDRFENATLKSIKKLDKTKTRGVDYFYEKMQLQAQLTEHPDFDNYRSSGSYLQAVDQSLDTLFVLYKYRLGSEIKNRERILDEKYTIRFWQAIEKEHENGLLANNITAILYQQLFLLLSQLQNDSLLDSFKSKFNNHLFELPLRDRKNLYYTTLNYLSRLINQGEGQYYAKILSWYQLGLREELLLTDKRISHITFNNIALLGYRDEQFEWTDQFINEYEPYLAAHLRKDAVQVSRAMGAFHRGNFYKAIRLFTEHRFAPAYELRGRLTIIRAYYELHICEEDVYEQLTKAIANFENFLNRNPVFSEKAKAPYRNHIRLLKKLMERQFRNRTVKDNGQWLAAELSSGIQVIAQEWLLEKARKAFK